MKKITILLLGLVLIYSCSTSTDDSSPEINIDGPDLTDIDGNTYQSVTNCGLTFTKQNLNVSKYSDFNTFGSKLSWLRARFGSSRLTAYYLFAN